MKMVNCPGDSPTETKTLFLEFNHCRMFFSIVDYTEGAVFSIFMTYISI